MQFKVVLVELEYSKCYIYFLFFWYLPKTLGTHTARWKQRFMHSFITSPPLANGAPHSCVVRVHSRYSVRWNLGGHMRCLSTLMIRLPFSSWKRVAVSTHMHIKTVSQTQTRAPTQLQPALGLCFSCWELPVNPTTCLKWQKNSIFQRTEVSKQGKYHWLSYTVHAELSSVLV